MENRRLERIVKDVKLKPRCISTSKGYKIHLIGDSESPQSESPMSFPMVLESPQWFLNHLNRSHGSKVMVKIAKLEKS